MFYHVRLDNMKRARMQKAKAKTGTEEEGNGVKSFLAKKYMFVDERCRLTKNIPICHANTYYFQMRQHLLIPSCESVIDVFRLAHLRVFQSYLPIHTIFYPKQFGHRPTPILNINTANCCPSNNVCFRKCIKQSSLWHQGLQT